MRKALLALSCVMLLAGIHAQAGPEAQAASVRDLFHALDLEKVINSSLDTSAENLANETTEPTKAKPKIDKFLQDKVGFAAVQDDMVKLYQKHFSEAEIQDLIKFYKTSTGQKLSKLQITLFKEGAAIGQNKMQAHQAELQKIMQEFKHK